MARLYADEHVPLAVVKALRRAGHDVLRSSDALGEGGDDDDHLFRAIGEDRRILTQDADFLSLSTEILSRGEHHPGIVYWPQQTYSIGVVIRRILAYLQTTSPEGRRDLVKFL
jgi:hypothetical protein